MLRGIVKRELSLCGSATPVIRPRSGEATRVMSFSTVKDSPQKFVRHLKENGVQRGFVQYDPEEGFKTSHPCFEPVVELLRNDKLDFHQHEAMFFEVGEQSGALMGAFLWWTYRGQGCGGIRLRSYRSLEEYVRDGVRLSLGMGRKSALAGLWWGGGKGVIVEPEGVDLTDKDFRRLLFQEYGEFITSLRGCYVAAEDSGVNVVDMDNVFKKTRYTTCISPYLGGSGNPSVPTAAGVVCAMEGALAYRGEQGLEGKTVAIQGVGNVGILLIKFLLEKNVKAIIASDISSRRIAEAKRLFPAEKVTLREAPIGDNSILFENCDIVAPCAWGGTLNDATIGKIRASIVCGAANNQLADPENGDRGLCERGITYVPDFVANRMGIVNCANEQYGRVGPLSSTTDPAISRHLGRDWENSVFNVTLKVLQHAADENLTPAQAGNALADQMAREPHPIWGHRTKQIVDSLVSEKWGA